MSKITFRADDELVDRVEALEASKSEVMRRALRAYLDEQVPNDRRTDARRTRDAGRAPDSLDALLEERIDAALEARRVCEPRDVNVNITVDGDGRATGPADADVAPERRSDEAAQPEPDEEGACPRCGEAVEADHVYCPNCGEKQSRRVFCDCGDELRTDWAFCPSCGRRTPAAEVLDNS